MCWTRHLQCVAWLFLHQMAARLRQHDRAARVATKGSTPCTSHLEDCPALDVAPLPCWPLPSLALRGACCSAPPALFERRWLAGLRPSLVLLLLLWWVVACTLYGGSLTQQHVQRWHASLSWVSSIRCIMHDDTYRLPESTAYAVSTIDCGAVKHGAVAA
jgi:hypothetical protein